MVRALGCLLDEIFWTSPIRGGHRTDPRHAGEIITLSCFGNVCSVNKTVIRVDIVSPGQWNLSILRISQSLAIVYLRRSGTIPLSPVALLFLALTHLFFLSSQ